MEAESREPLTKSGERTRRAVTSTHLAILIGAALPIDRALTLGPVEVDGALVEMKCRARRSDSERGTARAENLPRIALSDTTARHDAKRAHSPSG